MQGSIATKSHEVTTRRRSTKGLKHTGNYLERTYNSRLKIYVHYIFDSLFFKSKREHLSNKEKCFLFHFKSSFRSWDNQILTF